jgi:hypothetical protein
VKPEFRKARDRRGEYQIDWSRMEDSDTVQLGVQLIPFSAGDARVVSIPAEEVMLTAFGRGTRLEFGLFAMRLGESAVYMGIAPDRLRHLGAQLARMADLIEAQS